MTVKLGYCIHCGQANITCINAQKDGTMTHYSIAKQGECGPLIIDDVEIPETNWAARTPPPEPGLRASCAKCGASIPWVLCTECTPIPSTRVEAIAMELSRWRHDPENTGYPEEAARICALFEGAGGLAVSTRMVLHCAGEAVAYWLEAIEDGGEALDAAMEKLADALKDDAKYRLTHGVLDRSEPLCACGKERDHPLHSPINTSGHRYNPTALAARPVEAKAEAGKWRGEWICDVCGTILPNDKGRDYDSFTKTHLTHESGSYMGHKVCKGTLAHYERRDANRRSGPTPAAIPDGLRDRECETCSGSGVMSVLDHVETPNEKEVYVDAECGECHGTGVGWIGEWIDRALKAEAALAALRGEGEPPEPDPNADGPAERAHRQDEARRMK